MAGTVGAISLSFGVEAIASGGRRQRVPVFRFVLFGLVGLLGAAGDLRVLWSSPPRGVQRIARHLWRMSVALLIAAMLFWLWRVRFRRSFRGLRIASDGATKGPGSLKSAPVPYQSSTSLAP